MPRPTPPHLAIISHGYPPGLGGAEELTCRLAEGLVATGKWRVSVFTTTTLDAGGFAAPGPEVGQPHEIRNGVSIRRYPIWRPPSLGGRPGREIAGGGEFIQALRLGPVTPALWLDAALVDADLYLGTAFPYLTTIAALLLGRLRRVPAALLGCYHITDTECFNRIWQDHAIAAADRYFANSPAEAAYLASRIPGAAITTVVPGVQCRADRHRQAPQPPLHLLHVGHLQPRKRIMAMLRFLQRLNTGLPVSDMAHLTLVFPRAGEHVATIQALLASDPALAASVSLRERISNQELDKCYRQADYYLTFAEHESFGLAAHESFAYAVPVLHDGSSRQMAELLGDGAIRVDPQAPAETLRRQLHDPHHYTIASAAALRAAQSIRSWPVALAGYHQALCGLISQ